MFLTTPSITWPSASDWIRPVRCSARVSSRTVRRETTMLPRRRSILRIWNGWELFLKGGTSRLGRRAPCGADVHLRARQEGHGAVEVDGEAAFDLVEDDAVDLFVVLERLLELAPALLA